MAQRRFQSQGVRLISDALTTEAALPQSPAILTVESGAITELLITAEAPLEARSIADAGSPLSVEGLPEAWYTVARPPRPDRGRNEARLLILHPPDGDPSAPSGDYPFNIEWSPLGQSRESSTVPARLRVLPPGGTTMRSRLIEYLPAVFRDHDPFMARFLLIFQSVLDPIEQMINTTDLYLDPEFAPSRFLPWLSKWVGVAPDPDSEERYQRDHIRQAAELSSWKGTRRGLRQALEMATGGTVLISENFDGLRLGFDAALGITSELGERQPGSIAVTIVAAPTRIPDPARINALIDEMKPVFVRHSLRIIAVAELEGATDA